MRKSTFLVLATFALIGFIFFTCKKDTLIQKYPTKIINFDSTKAASLAKKIREDASVEVEQGLELSVWASDSLVHDPISISVAPDGRIFYTKASRQTNSEFDVRGHRNWITASVSFQTVEDRRAFIRKTFETDNEESVKFLKDLNNDGVRDWRDLTVEKEQVWFVTDESGDQIADRAQLYLEDFNEEITDVANGVEFYDGEVFIGVGPDLWRTKDVDNDSIADEATSISHGYAVHFGFSGHGMSGVTMGPDGRIWWGIGDIGMNVIDKSGKHWKYPNRGVVVRSEPDGSNFEVFAMGVRNTHEFVFDKYGNLISVDNDGDHSGESERLVYLIDGSDTGWRINWQFGKYDDPDNNKYKVWMDEKMYVPRWEGQAAYFLPPIQNYVNGPTGMVYNPGTALGPEYDDHFFVAEFRGTPTNSPIHAFTLKTDGAGFALDSTREIVKGLLPTGLDFGADGALYFGDWINGWGTKKEGRIWKLDITDAAYKKVRTETGTQTLLQADFSKEDISKFWEHIGHPDMRVRIKAQFELVKRGKDGRAMLEKIAKTAPASLARIHGMWGMGQIARKDKDYGKKLIPFLSSDSAEICAQAARLIGDARVQGASAELIKLLKHESPRVQFFAMEALGRTADKNGVQPILELLRVNDGKDIWIRQGGMIALSRIGDEVALEALRKHPSKELRIVGVVALRKMEHPAIGNFLEDEDEFIVAEAARGINDDFTIEEAMPALAYALKGTTFTGEPFIRRAINANLRIGKKENIQNLIDYINQKNAPDEMRAEAIAALSTWGNLSVFDRVDGRYRGEVKRDVSSAKDLFAPFVNTLLSEKNESVQMATARASAKLGVNESSTALLSLLKNAPSGNVRAAALNALYILKADGLENALEIALADKNDVVRSKALEILPNSKIDESKAIALFEDIIKSGTIKEKQSAILSLGDFKSEGAIHTLTKLMFDLRNNKLPKEVHLDLLEVVEGKDAVKLKEQLEKFNAAKDENDLFAQFKETLYGGDRRKGNDVFYGHDGAQCTRCHAVWEYGGNAGPTLDGVASRLSQEQLLLSLIDPSAEYALGYEIAYVTLKDGNTVTGVVTERNKNILKLKLGKEDIRTIQQSEIEKSESLPSSMLPMKDVLTKRELRDLMAFLKELKKHDN